MPLYKKIRIYLFTGYAIIGGACRMQHGLAVALFTDRAVFDGVNTGAHELGHS